MKETGKRPWTLKAAAVTMAVGQLVIFIFPPATVVGAVSAAATVFVAWLVWRGESRVAWILAVVWAAGQMAGSLALDQPRWFAVAPALALLWLLLPASREFVWSSGQRKGSTSESLITRMSKSLLVASSRLTTAWSPGMTGSRSEAGKKIGLSRGKQIAALVVCLLILYPIVGVVYDFQHGSGRGNVFANILWHVIWGCYVVVQVSLIALIAVTAYRYLTNRRERLT